MGGGQGLLDSGRDLRVEDEPLLLGQTVRVQIAGQRGLDTAPRCRLMARHRPAHPSPMIELLLGRPALASTLGSGAVHQVGGDPGDAIGDVRHTRTSCSRSYGLSADATRRSMRAAGN